MTNIKWWKKVESHVSQKNNTFKEPIFGSETHVEVVFLFIFFCRKRVPELQDVINFFEFSGRRI